MSQQKYYPGVIVTFKKKNGEVWNETYSYRLIDMFKRNPEVYEIRYTDTDKLIYRRDN